MTLNAAQACMLHEHVLTCSGCSGNGSANSSSGSHRFHISHQTPCHLSRVQVHRPVLVAGGLAGNGLQLGRRRHARLGALAAREGHAWGAQHRQQRVAHLARRPQPALGKGLRGSSFDVSAQLENCPAAPAAHRPPRPPTIAGSSRTGSSRRCAPQQAFSQTTPCTNKTLGARHLARRLQPALCKGLRGSKPALDACWQQAALKPSDTMVQCAQLAASLATQYRPRAASHEKNMRRETDQPARAGAAPQLRQCRRGRPERTAASAR